VDKFPDMKQTGKQVH